MAVIEDNARVAVARKDFERWAKRKGYDVRRYTEETKIGTPGAYLRDTTELLWGCWKDATSSALRNRS